jgi:hypothetical protein
MKKLNISEDSRAIFYPKLSMDQIIGLWQMKIEVLREEDKTFLETFIQFRKMLA